MTESKSTASSIVVPSIFVIHLMNGPLFLNATGVGFLWAVVMISSPTRMQASLQSQRLDSTDSALYMISFPTS